MIVSIDALLRRGEDLRLIINGKSFTITPQELVELSKIIEQSGRFQ